MLLKYQKMTPKNNKVPICTLIYSKTFTYWHSIKTNKIFKKLIYIVISHQRNELYERINTRCSKIFNMDCLDEIDSFLKNDMTFFTNP